MGIFPPFLFWHIPLQSDKIPQPANCPNEEKLRSALSFSTLFTPLKSKHFERERERYRVGANWRRGNGEELQISNLFQIQNSYYLMRRLVLRCDFSLQGVAPAHVKQRSHPIVGFSDLSLSSPSFSLCASERKTQRRPAWPSLLALARVARARSLPVRGRRRARARARARGRRATAAAATGRALPSATATPEFESSGAESTALLMARRATSAVRRRWISQLLAET